MQGKSNIEAAMDRLRLDVPQRFVLLSSAGGADAVARLAEKCKDKDAAGWVEECERAVLTYGTAVARADEDSPKSKMHLGALMEMIHLRWRCDGLEAAGWTQYVNRRLSDVATALTNFVARADPSQGAFPKHPDAWVRWLQDERDGAPPEAPADGLRP